MAKRMIKSSADYAYIGIQGFISEAYKARDVAKLKDLVVVARVLAAHAKDSQILEAAERSRILAAHLEVESRYANGCPLEVFLLQRGFMQDMLSGKRALVTGAARGLGRGFTEAMLKEGATVYLCDVNQTVLSNTVGELKKQYGEDKILHGIFDISVERELQAMFGAAHKALGGLDIVANNAGIMNESKMEMMIQLNFTAMIRGTQLAMEYMDPDNGGSGGLIINTASIYGLIDHGLTPVYTATKTGIIGYTSCIAMQQSTKDKKIRINCICPSVVETELITNIPDGAALDTPFVRDIAAKIPKLSVSTVADAFMEVIKNEKMQGECMVVRLNHENLICTLKKDMDMF